jgi:hypothetical protein
LKQSDNLIEACRIWGSHRGGYEELNLLGYTSVSEEHVTSIFRVKEQDKQQNSWICHLLSCCFLLDLFLDPEVRGNIFLQNVGWLSTGYTALYPRRQNSLSDI